MSVTFVFNAIMLFWEFNPVFAAVKPFLIPQHLTSMHTMKLTFFLQRIFCLFLYALLYSSNFLKRTTKSHCVMPGIWVLLPDYCVRRQYILACSFLLTEVYRDKRLQYYEGGGSSLRSQRTGYLVRYWGDRRPGVCSLIRFSIADGQLCAFLQ